MGKTAEPFRARSGRIVRVEENGTVVFDHVNGYLSPGSTIDAEEFFQHRRDLERGWWRWPENPTCVVKEGERTDLVRGRTVYVFDEESFDRFHFNERVREADESTTIAHRAARAYFEAHPERKPWHDAKPNEAWVLVVDGEEYPWAVGTGPDVGRFVYLGGLSNIPIDHPSITAGRRIWPEDAS